MKRLVTIQTCCFQLGPNWVAIRDSRTTKPMLVNGEHAQQKTLSTGDVIQIGSTKFVFIRNKSSTPNPPLKSFTGNLFSNTNNLTTPKTDESHVFETLEDEDEEIQEFPLSHFTLSHRGSRVATSEGEALTIGSDLACSMRLDGSEVFAFHCLVCRGKEGVSVVAFGSQISIEDRLVTKSVISDTEQLCLGNQVMIDIGIDGEPAILYADKRGRTRGAPVAFQVAAKPLIARTSAAYG